MKIPNRKHVLVLVNKLVIAVAVALFFPSCQPDASKCCQAVGEKKTEFNLDLAIGQMVMVGFRGATISDSDVIVSDIKNVGIGGVILFEKDVAATRQRDADGKRDPSDYVLRNIESPAQVRELVRSLQSRASVPLLVAIDEEGGRVNRLKARYGFTPTTSPATLGQLPPDESFNAGRQVGKMLAELGINLDFAPVVDVNVNPDNPVIGKIGRSFSADPAVVTDRAERFIAGLHQSGVMACIKHFPGHGSAYNDSHLGVTDVTDYWKELELDPFRAIANRPAGDASRCDMVMTAHIFNKNWDDKYPASLSKKVIDGMLRTQLGWDGVVITDDLQMKAIASQFGLEQTIFLAIDAGVDILLFGNNLDYDQSLAAKVRDTVKKLVADGKISPERIRKSYDRIMTLKKKLAAK